MTPNCRIMIGRQRRGNPTGYYWVDIPVRIYNHPNNKTRECQRRLRQMEKRNG